MCTDLLNVEGREDLTHLRPVIQRQDEPPLQSGQLLGHGAELVAVKQAVAVVALAGEIGCRALI